LKTRKRNGEMEQLVKFLYYPRMYFIALKQTFNFHHLSFLNCPNFFYIVCFRAIFFIAKFNMWIPMTNFKEKL